LDYQVTAQGEAGTLSVPAEVYDSHYYLYGRGGSAEFRTSYGREVFRAHETALRLAGIEKGQLVLDLGAGCGEIVVQCAMRGAKAIGVDYSADAVRLAREAVRRFPQAIQRRWAFVHADVCTIPFRGRQFDRVFLLDVLEHLYPSQILNLYSQLRRVLRPDGKIIIHTFPNRWHSDYIYPLTVRFWRLFGRRPPLDPRTECDRIMHVNEQSVFSVRADLRANGFSVSAWVSSFAEENAGVLERAARWLFQGVGPSSWLFGNEIWAVATPAS